MFDVDNDRTNLEGEAYFFLFKQKTAYEVRMSDWSSDVCASDLLSRRAPTPPESDIPSMVRSADSERCSRGSFITASMPSSIRCDSCTVIGAPSCFTSWRMKRPRNAR